MDSCRPPPWFEIILCGPSLTFEERCQTPVVLASRVCKSPLYCGQLSVGGRRGLPHFQGDLHHPARVLAHLLDATTRMDRVEACLSTAFRKPEYAQRRDDRRRSPAQQPVAFAPASRAVAVPGRSDERDAVDEATLLVVHKRHPPAAEDRDVGPSPAPR